jgi:Uma2 family endonuclease
MTAQAVIDQKQQYYTPEEYLALEEKADYKSEYYDGLIIPMAGGTTNHNQIIGNLYSSLNFGLKRQPYRVFFSDVRLWIPETRYYKYPDIMVIAGQPEYHDNRKDTIINPQVVIEVLSGSTQAYDRDEKFKAYRTIPSFQEYVLIDQTSVAIDQYFKTGNKRWSLYEYDHEESELSFKSFDFQLPLAELYDKVELAAATEARKE